MSYQIILPQFEGPFDLLLFFIERDELNVHDIPIHKITKDFLSYIHQLEQLNIEIAGEFILVASTLMRIKAKMLLPRKDIDEKGNEIDPRKELVDRILEYKRYKEAAQTLKDWEEARAFRHIRGNITSENKEILSNLAFEGDLEPINLFKLVKNLQKVMDRFKYQQEKVEHKVVMYHYTIENEKNLLENVIIKGGRKSLKDTFSDCENRMHVIFRLLAILEMVQQQLLRLDIGEGYNNCWVNAA